MPITTDPAAGTALPAAVILPFLRRPPAADLGGNDDEPRRLGTISIQAPPEARCQALGLVVQAATDRLADRHLAVCVAACHLLSIADVDLAGRVHAMLSDQTGRDLLGELVGALDDAARDMEAVRVALFSARARIAAFAAGGARAQ